MGRKPFDFDDVKTDFASEGCLLLESNYVSAKTRMKYKCSCGEIGFTSLQLFRKGVRCKKCSSLKRRKSRLKNISYDEVKEQFSERGYELLEKHYRDTTTKMKYKCPNHPDKDTRISLEKLQAGRGCYYCRNERINRDRKLTYEEVKREFADRGYKLLSANYGGYHEKLEFECPKHRNEKLNLTLANLRAGQGCRYCSFEARGKKLSGVNASNWNGGVTRLNHFLRREVNQWRKRALENYNYRCFITEENTNQLQVHHVKSFRTIRDEVLSELDMPVYKKMGEYTKEQLDMMVEKVKEKHDEVAGVPIRKDLHQLFHKIYGYQTSVNDIYEFKERYLSGEFGEIKPKQEQLNMII